MLAAVCFGLSAPALRLLSLFLRCNPRLLAFALSLAFASWLMLLSLLLLLLLLLFWLGVRWRCVFVFGAGLAAVVVLVLVACVCTFCSPSLPFSLFFLLLLSSWLSTGLVLLTLALCCLCVAFLGAPGGFGFGFGLHAGFCLRPLALSPLTSLALLPCFGPGSPLVCSSALPLGFVAVPRLVASLLFVCGVGRVPLPSTSRCALRSALWLRLRCVAVVSGFCFAALLAVRFAVSPAWSGASGRLGLPSALVRCHWPAWLWRLPGFCFGGSGLWLCFPGCRALVVVLLVLLGVRRMVLCRPVWLFRGPGFALGLPIPPFSASALLALPCRSSLLAWPFYLLCALALLPLHARLGLGFGLSTWRRTAGPIGSPPGASPLLSPCSFASLRLCGAACLALPYLAKLPVSGPGHSVSTFASHLLVPGCL